MCRIISHLKVITIKINLFFASSHSVFCSEVFSQQTFSFLKSTSPPTLKPCNASTTQTPAATGPPTSSHASRWPASSPLPSFLPEVSGTFCSAPTRRRTSSTRRPSPTCVRLTSHFRLWSAQTFLSTIPSRRGSSTMSRPTVKLMGKKFREKIN